MQTTRRVFLLGAMLLVPVLLAVAGGLLAAPAGPPKADTRPVQLGPGPDGVPALGLEPPDTPALSRPSASPEPLPPVIETPPAVPAPAPPAAPVPVLPPVVIDDDDVDGAVPDDDADDADDVDDGEPDDE